MKPAVHTARPPSQSGRPAGETGEDQASRIELSEIDVMRLDAAFRALPDHVDRPDGPAPAIEAMRHLRRYVELLFATPDQGQGAAP